MPLTMLERELALELTSEPVTVRVGTIGASVRIGDGVLKPHPVMKESTRVVPPITSVESDNRGSSSQDAVDPVLDGLEEVVVAEFDAGPEEVLVGVAEMDAGPLLAERVGKMRVLATPLGSWIIRPLDPAVTTIPSDKVTAEPETVTV